MRDATGCSTWQKKYFLDFFAGAWNPTLAEALNTL